jgi:hypothetical protein
MAAALPAVAQPVPEDWRLERSERTWPLAAATSVTVANPFGDLLVRTSDRPEVYLLANTQRHRDDPRELVVEARQEPGTLSIAIGFGAVEPQRAPAEIPAAWVPRRCDVTVFVPRSAATHFSTREGLLEIRGTIEPTEAETWSGDLRLRILGPVTAHTEHGDVLVQFRRTDWALPVAISTVSGEIRVEMPEGGGAEVALATRGEITSDYSTEVERQEGSLLKRARLVVGGGGGSLRLDSYQGAIKVLQSLVPLAQDSEEDGD